MVRVRKTAFLPMGLTAEARAVLDTLELCEAIRRECDEAQLDVALARGLEAIEEAKEYMEGAIQGTRFG